MKHISALRVLLFFSFFCISQSCKIETKNEFSLEETRAMEQGKILQLLDRAKNQIRNDQLQEAILSLDSIIDNYGTYEEVEEAYILKETARDRFTIEKILTLKNMDSLMIYIVDSESDDIKQSAEQRLSDLITTTDDPQILQDFLDTNQMVSLRPNAKKRQEELLKQKEEILFGEASQKNNAKTWKKFLKMYPDHPQKNSIEDNIIKLEVDEIFNGEYGEIPTSNKMGATNYVTSDLEITNNTSYTLTLRYSGPENRRIIISPGATQDVQLKSGDYRVTASVNATRVNNYAGRESLNGMYTSSYYISN